MEWEPWTDKSHGIDFKSNIKGIGDGENKVAAEFDTVVLGQNSDHDMVLLIHGIPYKCDVKKLDKGSFNTGAKGRNYLRPIKHNIIDLLNINEKIIDSDILSGDEKTLLLKIKDVSPDELCVSNLVILYNICDVLYNKQQSLRATLPIIKPFAEINGMSLDNYYIICEILNEPFPDEYSIYTDTILFLKNISHEYISNPRMLSDSLNSLTVMFNDIKIVFADEEKGYCICHDLTKIQFQRITRGNPRFIVNF